MVNKQLNLQYHGVNIKNDELNKHFVAKMYNSNKFTAKDMKAWEEKDEADKNNWDIITDYFKECWNPRKCLRT